MRAKELFEKEESEKKTLYCNRKVLNGDDILEWAKSQGFEKCLDPSEFHVTIAFSKKEIDWDQFTEIDDEITVEATTDGRDIKLFGQAKNAVVLGFESENLHERWEEFTKEFGASWDFDGYHPHVTITYDGLPEDMDLEDIEPYSGKIELGPEIFAEVDLNWAGKVKETKLDDDSVD